jgi:hypothetical protein
MEGVQRSNRIPVAFSRGNARVRTGKEKGSSQRGRSGPQDGMWIRHGSAPFTDAGESIERARRQISIDAQFVHATRRRRSRARNPRTAVKNSATRDTSKRNLRGIARSRTWYEVCS